MNMTMYGGADYIKPGTKAEDIEILGIKMHPSIAVLFIGVLMFAGIGLVILCVYLIRKFYMRNSAS